MCGHTKLGCQIGARLAHKGRLQIEVSRGIKVGPRCLSWHLHKGVAQTLADALDGDLGVAVVVAVIVAHTHLRKIDFEIRVSIND